LPLYPGGGDAEAMGVSRDGSTVVGQASTGSATFPDVPPRQAVVWRDGQITALGDLDGEGVASIGRAASGDGSVVVGAGNLFNPQAWRYVSSSEGQAVRFVNGAVTPLAGTAGPRLYS